MPRQVAISIGVSSSGELPELPGASEGAADFASWARAAGYEVTEFTDAEGRSVTGADIFAAIRAAARTMDVERLVVYFAGHGVSKGAGVDYWLLSDAPEDPNATVDVAASLRLARAAGIPHVVVIADACRTMAGKDHKGIGGYVIFPDRDDHNVELDQFFGSVSGDPAYEITSDTKELAAYGIFTSCVMEALQGRAAAATERVDPNRSDVAVTARRLKDFLLSEVPLRAARRGLKQRPDCIPGSFWPPNVIAWVRGPQETPPDDEPPDFEPEADVLTVTRDFGGMEEADAPFAISIGGEQPAAIDDDVRAAAESLSEAGRLHFESGSGLTILGAAPRTVALPKEELKPFEEEGHLHVRGGGDAAPAVIDLGDGRFAAVALLPGFVATVHVGRSGVDLVSYRGAAGGDYEEGDEAARALGLLGAATRCGLYDVPLGEAADIGDYFRRYEHQNPTFAIISAYAYDRAGRTGEIAELISTFENAGQVVPYDLVLLARVDPDEVAAPIAPSFPLMTHGWAYLEADRLSDEMSAARASLAPSVWATPTDEGGRGMYEALLRGDLT